MSQLTNNNLEQLKAQYESNPLFNRAQQMAQGKTPQELEQIARNLCAQRGIDFSQAWESFQQRFGRNF